MACLWSRGLPAQPLPPKVSWAQASESGLVLSVCPYACVGGGEDWDWQLSAQGVLPSCSWKGLPGGLNPHPSSQGPQGNHPSCLADPTPRATVWLELQLLSATCLSGTPLAQFLRSDECL